MIGTLGSLKLASSIIAGVLAGSPFNNGSLVGQFLVYTVPTTSACMFGASAEAVISTEALVL